MHRLAILTFISIALVSALFLSHQNPAGTWLPVTYGAELKPAIFPNAESALNSNASTSVQKSTAAPQKESATPRPVVSGPATAPQQLSIPSIGLNDPIIGVGLTASGDMGVPSGKTKNVGWYRDGTVPGTIGSAVLDAHIFAAFASLKNMRVGDDVYVIMNNGAKLHFRVTDMETYALAAIPLERLFNDARSKNLNLITCAGTYIPSQGTYDHRLIVYTTLVEA